MTAAKLKEWLMSWLQARDEIEAAGLELKENTGGFDVIARRKPGNRYFLLSQEITDVDALLKRAGSKHAWIVTRNTPENVEALLKHWGRAAKHRNTAFCFVDLTNRKHWTVYPYTHNLISDPATLRHGLLSLAESARI